MQTDILLKRLMDLCAADLLPLIGTPDAQVLGVDPVELPATATRVDTLLRVRDPQGDEYLHLVEWQGYPDALLLWRVMGYLAWLGQHRRERPILATVIYLKPSDDVGDTLMQSRLTSGWSWRVPVVRLWELDANEAVQSGNLGFAVLSPLMGNANAATVERAVEQVLTQAAPVQQPELMSILGVFAEAFVDPQQLMALIGKERLMESKLLNYLMEERAAEFKREQETLAQERDTVVRERDTVVRERDTVVRERDALRRQLELQQSPIVTVVQQLVEDALITRFPLIPAVSVRPLRELTDHAKLVQLHRAILSAPDVPSAERLIAEAVGSHE